MRRRVLLLTVACLLILNLKVFAETPLFLDATGSDNFKVLFIPKVKEAPQIDGNLDDKAWGKVKWVDDFNHCAYGARRFPFPKTKFKTLWDKNYLYIAFKCFEDSAENMKKHLALVNNKSKPIYSRDCIELHIDGNNDNATRFQIWFIDTAEKMIFWHYDFGWGILVNQNFGLSADWNYAVKQGKMSWTFEARISLENLQIKPKVGTMFGMNPVRFRFAKDGVRDDGKKFKNGVSQFLAWSTQGGDHHDVRKFGKCILVDKMPSSVEAGLRLAYPDLNKRKLMIQTPSGFDIFNKGKISRTSYFETLKRVLEQTKAIANKAKNVLEKDATIAKSYLKNPIDDNLKKIAILSKKINAKKTISVGELNNLRKQLNKISDTLNTNYWKIKRNLLLLGKIDYKAPKSNVKHISIPLDELENKPNPESRQFPFVPWAKKYYRGKIKALIITAEGSSWNAYELKRRMDLNVDIFYATQRVPTPNIGPKTDYYKEGIVLYPKKKKNLEILLRNKYDVIVFLDFSPESLPIDLQYDLTGKLINGTSIVSFIPRLWRFLPTKKYPLKKDSTIIRTIPFRYMTQLVKTGKVDYALNEDEIGNYQRKIASLNVPPVQKYKIGKGNYYSFWPGGGGYYFTSAISPSKSQDPDELFQVEYYFSLATQLIINAASKESNIQVKEVICSQAPYASGQKGTASVLTKGSKFIGKLETIIRNKFGKVINRSQKAFQKNADKEFSFKIDIPALNAGDYYVDAILWKANKKYSWASQRFCVKGKSNIDSLTILPITSVEKGKNVKVKVTLSNNINGETLKAILRSTQKRILWKRENIKISGKQVTISVPTNYTDQVMNKIDICLVYKGIVQDVKTVDIFVTNQDIDDFIIFTDGCGFNYYGSLRHKVLRKKGVSMFETNFNPIDILGSGNMLSSRYWLTHTEKFNGGSLASAFKLKEVGRSVKAYAKTLASRDGRFLSTGDDSGTADDFIKTYPNWVLPFIKGLAKRWREDNKKRKIKLRSWEFVKKRGLGRKEFRYLLYQSNLEEYFNMKFQPGDFAILINSFKQAYPNIAEFNRANGTNFKSFEVIKKEDIKKIKPPFYADIIGFQDWLKKKYKTIKALNKAWGSNEKSFNTLNPKKVIPALIEVGRYLAKLDKSEYLEDLFINEMKITGDAVRSVSKNIGVGQGAANFDNVIPEVLEHTDTYAPYLSDVNFEIGRSFPHRWMGQTLGVYGGKKVNVNARKQRVWHILFTGGNFMWYWSASNGLLMGDLSMNPGRAGAMASAMQEAKQGIAATIIRSKRQHDGIAILHSRLSGHMSEIKKQFSTQRNSQSAFQYIIEDLGLQYRYISSKNIENSILRTNEFKLLLLPYTQILSKKEAEEIKRFVRNGGSVIADMRTGTYSEIAQALTNTYISDLFGIKYKSTLGKSLKGKLILKIENAMNYSASGILTDASLTLVNKSKAYGDIEGVPTFIVNNYGKGKAVFLNFGISCYNFLLGKNMLGDMRNAFQNIISKCGVQAQFKAINNLGKEIEGVEMALFKRDRITILTAEKKALQFEKYPIEGFIALPAKYYVTDMRSGKDMGLTDKIPVTMVGLSCHVWSLLPYKVKSINISTKRTRIKAGEDLLLNIALKSAKAKLGTHVLRLDIIDPFGKEQTNSKKLDAKNGKLKYVYHSAYNDPSGKWTIVLTDILTGLSEKIIFNLTQR